MKNTAIQVAAVALIAIAAIYLLRKTSVGQLIQIKADGMARYGDQYEAYANAGY